MRSKAMELADALADVERLKVPVKVQGFVVWSTWCVGVQVFRGNHAGDPLGQYAFQVAAMVGPFGVLVGVPRERWVKVERAGTTNDIQSGMRMGASAIRAGKTLAAAGQLNSAGTIKPMAKNAGETIRYRRHLPYRANPQVVADTDATVAAGMMAFGGPVCSLEVHKASKDLSATDLSFDEGFDVAAFQALRKRSP